MRGLWFEDGAVRLRADLEAPASREGHTRVQVILAGVCATDLALRRGYMGFRGVPGHEFVGRALDGPLAGRRVVGEINAACGQCVWCAQGLGRHCPQRSVLGILNHGGAFAEQLVLPDGNLHPVPDAVSDRAATFSEPLAAACEILEQVDPASIGEALVVGDGRLGLLCAQVLGAAGVEVDVLGRHPERFAFTRGVRGWVDAPAGPSYPLVVEATGKPEVLQAALGWVHPRGSLVLKTTAERAAPLDLAPLVVHEITLIGSRCGPFEPALAALSSGQVDVEAMVHASLPLERGEEALDLADQRGVLKVLLEIGSC